MIIKTTRTFNFLFFLSLYYVPFSLLKVSIVSSYLRYFVDDFYVRYDDVVRTSLKSFYRNINDFSLFFGLFLKNRKKNFFQTRYDRDEKRRERDGEKRERRRKERETRKERREKRRMKERERERKLTFTFVLCLFEFEIFFFPKKERERERQTVKPT